MTNNPDVLIIGAGIVGATCAWRLAQSGVKVTVLERDAPASHASQAALGSLTFHAKPEMPATFQTLCIESKQYFPAMIDELTHAVGERVPFRAGGQVLVAPAEADMAYLEEAYSVNVERGIAVERPTAQETRLLEPGLNPDVRGAVFFPDDAWVDNTALALAIVRAAQAAGAVFERAEVTALESRAGRVSGVRAAGETWEAGAVVLAAGCWSGQIEGAPPLPVVPVKGQAFAVAGQPVRRVIMSPRGYLVPRGPDQTLVGATAEWVGFDTSITAGGLHEVSVFGLELSPALRGGEFLGAWAGLRPGTPDNLPFIGPFAELPNLIAATGHFRNGILLAPITADLVCALVTGAEPPVALEPFLPGRIRRPAPDRR